MAPEKPARLPMPNIRDLYKYRFGHGTNLGSVFCLEAWLTGSMFPAGAGSSELAAVTASLQESGLDATIQKFESHWRNYISDGDLDWLVNEAQCNSVRLPIGYWTLGSAYTRGTPFEPVARVYEHAWTAVKDLITRCEARNIGVLVDFHGLPGGANGNDHSGTNSGRAELWENDSFKTLSVDCLHFIASQLRDVDNVIGIQICNEAEGSALNKGLWEFYDRAISAISTVDPSIPIYLSDAWNLPNALSAASGRNNMASNLNPLVIDTHKYFCFSDVDTNKAPKQIIKESETTLSSLPTDEVHKRGASPVVVGEYSCVMSETSWQQSPEQRNALVDSFGRAQSSHYNSSAMGSYFWTYRMDWMPGGEWGFKEQVTKGHIRCPQHLQWTRWQVRLQAKRARDNALRRREETVRSHCEYWDKNYPGEYDHGLFERGWDTGFEDAAALFEMRETMVHLDGGEDAIIGGDKLGSIDLWVLKRLRDAKVEGRFVWEFEHGIRQGLRDFYGLAGVP
ncbi:glycoside hydrolase family 5 protein [Myriangium duriaei CBS 260.36]|uniref:Glycoside hydrolase family 5 protein n=1 Tax=Myriangium duriaei CBS 260.36 TaxID=1168546 RepID=A0A9P4IUR2_9PEZI|nr:glycoside hydrolase family 5 protein [Myriangium duriaei CBS 260.36]